MRVLGVDPGIRQGLAVVEIADGAAPDPTPTLEATLIARAQQ